MTQFGNIFLKGAQAGGRTWDLLVFVYFLSLKQRLRPSSALDHSATAPPYTQFGNILKHRIDQTVQKLFDSFYSF